MDHEHQVWQGEERRSLSHLEIQLHEIQSTLNELRGAFPNGDTKGHCEAHEAMIRAAKAEETFWRELKMDFAKKGIWFVFIILLGMVWVGVLAKLGIGGSKL